MTRLCERADALAALVRRCVLATLGSEGLFLVVMLLFNGVLNTQIFLNSAREIGLVRDYIVMPWSGLLLGMYLMREKRHSGIDTWAPGLLVMWLAVPFMMRFGAEYGTLYSLFGYTISFFVCYASVSDRDAVTRGYQLDTVCAGVGLLSIVLGGALLYCAWTGEVFYSYVDTEHFGVIKGQLQHAAHYNMTAMLALVCTMTCIVGLCRSKKKPLAAFYLLGAVIMTLVVVLTQSRTARYAMLAAYALGTWNALGEYLPIRRTLMRHGAALAVAAVVLVGGFKLCTVITDAALAHYAGAPSKVAQMIVPSAAAEDEAAKAVEKAEKPLKARKAGSSTFSDRTNIWKNIFKNWKENPRHMLIGNGSGRTMWLIAENTIHESRGYVKAHNAYLHFAAEFGLIGFAMLAVFMGSMVPAVLRVFFARGKKRVPGGCALCMLVVSILITGMMEIEPLDILTPMCLVLFFALGQLVGMGRDIKRADDAGRKA